ncbi:MAG: hypothetical protein QOD06_2580 [Candidatus Binatota bacterium]|nr:hypothetical protein [Candidatus Binatota bacterium]
MNLPAPLVRARLSVRNRWIEDRRLKALLARTALAVARRLPDPRKRLKAAERFLLHNPTSPDAAAVVRDAVVWARQGDWVRRPNETPVLQNAILAKRRVSDREKGILLLQFEPELLKLATSPALPAICAQYDVIFVATWQPFFSIPLLILLGRMTEPFWLMPSSQRDGALCESLGVAAVPLPFQASSWILPETFPVGDAPRDIDLLMVANFSTYKRHWLLFEALRELPRELEVVIAGRPWGGRTRQALLREAEAYGVADRFSIVESPSNHRIADLMSRSRLFCALSNKEGSYIAVGEALMAGAPVGMFEDAVIGSKEYIGPETGVLFRRDEPLAPQIRRFLDSSHPLRPDVWARRHISCRTNVRRLNDILSEAARDRGRAWTEDVPEFYCENFVFRCVDPSVDGVMTGAYRDFEQSYGLRIARPPVSASDDAPAARAATNAG